MEIEGKITAISEIEKVGEKQYEKLTFTVQEDKEEYPNAIVLTLFGDKVSYIKKMKVGDLVTAGFNSKISEYNGKQYNNINCWKLVKVGEIVGQKDKDDSLPF